jgi:outer membrane lipoprotein-sorting protein
VICPPIFRRLAFSTLATLAFCASSSNARAEAPGTPEDMAVVNAWIAESAKIDTAKIGFVQERRLRALKKPLVTEGQLWYAAPSAFRWQLGDPPKFIAAKQPDGDVVILHPKKKTAEVRKAEEIKEDAQARGMAFLEAGFPTSLEGFEKTFEIVAVSRGETGNVEMEAKFRDAKAAAAVRKLVFSIGGASSRLLAIELFFRDSSRIFTRLTDSEFGLKIDPSLFKFDLEGYTIEGGAE